MKPFVFLLALWPAVARAEIVPTPGSRDPQIQAVQYDPDQVVRLSTTPGFLLVVEFSPDERIETIALGNNAGWQATSNRRGNHLFIKQEAGAADTNMTVISDARRYTFTLVPGSGANALFAYNVRFTYAGMNAVPEIAVEPGGSSWKLSGARGLGPVEMFDNGQATSIRWAPDAAIPAIFAVDDSGEETIVNGAMRDGFFVVDAVPSKFVFRLAKKSASATRMAGAAK